MELILIRHGLPFRDETTSDPPLTDEGLEQSRKVAEWLAGEKIDSVYASTMHRARQTAEPLVALQGHELQLNEKIVEFDRNTGSYIPMEELKRTDYPRWKAMVDGGFDIDIGEFSTDVVTAIEQIIADNQGKTAAIFCHGGVINVWTCHVLGLEPRLFFEPHYTSIHRYLCARSGQRNVVSLNERAHLR